jgi:hypothetical protein
MLEKGRKKRVVGSEILDYKFNMDQAKEAKSPAPHLWYSDSAFAELQDTVLYKYICRYSNCLLLVVDRGPKTDYFKNTLKFQKTTSRCMSLHGLTDWNRGFKTRSDSFVHILLCCSVKLVVLCYGEVFGDRLLLSGKGCGLGR